MKNSDKNINLTDWKYDWFHYYLLGMVVISIILLILVLIKEGFPLP